MSMAVHAETLVNLKDVLAAIESFVGLNLLYPDNSTMFKTFLESLECCQMYFYMASNEMPLQNESDYRSSWVVKQRICYTKYIRGEKILKLNFPTLPSFVMKNLHYILKDITSIDSSHYPLIQGYVLEDTFFSFLATSQHLSLYDGTDELTYSVKLSPIIGEINSLKTNVLHRLRQYHPAIDAVGLFSRESDIKICLLFIQISTSFYKNHKSKIIDLVGNTQDHRGYRELKGTQFSSLQEYYSSKVSTCVEDVYYVYISLKTTKESLENGSQIKLDASRYKIKYAVLSIASNMYREFSKTLHMI